VADITNELSLLRSQLEEPLKEAESRAQQEKFWLETLYKSLTGGASSSPEQTALVTAYTLEFMSERLPVLIETVEVS
jgi:hypothetical protein